MGGRALSESMELWAMFRGEGSLAVHGWHAANVGRCGVGRLSALFWRGRAVTAKMTSVSVSRLHVRFRSMTLCRQQ
jgi:hypothetical protein